MFTRRDAGATGSTTEDTQRTTTTTTPTPTSVAPAPQPVVAPPVASQQPTATPTQRTGGSDESLVARGDTFEGQIRTTRGVRVMGTVRGGIESDQYVHIEENAQVEADITAEEVVIAGEYTGKLNCRQRVEIRATGRVSGQIETQKLLLHEGGFFDGEMRMQKPTGTTASNTSPAAKPANDDANKGRRTRYVDLSSDSAAREVGATDSSAA